MKILVLIVEGELISMWKSCRMWLVFNSAHIELSAWKSTRGAIFFARQTLRPMFRIDPDRGDVGNS